MKKNKKNKTISISLITLMLLLPFVNSIDVSGAPPPNYLGVIEGQVIQWDIKIEQSGIETMTADINSSMIELMNFIADDANTGLEASIAQIFPDSVLSMNLSAGICELLNNFTAWGLLPEEWVDIGYIELLNYLLNTSIPHMIDTIIPRLINDTLPPEMLPENWIENITSTEILSSVIEYLLPEADQLWMNLNFSSWIDFIVESIEGAFVEPIGSFAIGWFDSYDLPTIVDALLASLTTVFGDISLLNGWTDFNFTTLILNSLELVTEDVIPDDWLDMDLKTVLNVLLEANILTAECMDLNISEAIGHVISYFSSELIPIGWLMQVIDGRINNSIQDVLDAYILQLLTSNPGENPLVGATIKEILNMSLDLLPDMRLLWGADEYLNFSSASIRDIINGVTPLFILNAGSLSISDFLDWTLTYLNETIITPLSGSLEFTGDFLSVSLDEIINFGMDILNSMLEVPITTMLGLENNLLNITMADILNLVPNFNFTILKDLYLQYIIIGTPPASFSIREIITSTLTFLDGVLADTNTMAGLDFYYNFTSGTVQELIHEVVRYIKNTVKYWTPFFTQFITEFTEFNEILELLELFFSLDTKMGLRLTIDEIGDEIKYLGFTGVPLNVSLEFSPDTYNWFNIPIESLNSILNSHGLNSDFFIIEPSSTLNNTLEYFPTQIGNSFGLIMANTFEWTNTNVDFVIPAGLGLDFLGLSSLQELKEISVVLNWNSNGILSETVISYDGQNIMSITTPQIPPLPGNIQGYDLFLVVGLMSLGTIGLIYVILKKKQL
jgi:hypothetical protein